MTDIEKKVRADATPKIFYKEYDIEIAGKRIIFPGGTTIVGASLIKHIGGAKRCAVMAVTLGAGIDHEIRKLQLSDMAAALSYDGCANDYIEELCDAAENEIAGRANALGLFITSRYSPGYGDFSLDNQSTLLRLVSPRAGCGITTLLESNLLVPQKSVTAVIGYVREKSERTDKCENCPSKKKCKDNRMC